MLRDGRTDGGGRRPASRNVLGEPLELCSIKPMTGFYRDGCCNTGREDFGSHTVCVVLTSAFLEFSKSRGNDLSTPMPEFGFPGLKPGDRWCLCAPRWREAFAPSPISNTSQWTWRERSQNCTPINTRLGLVSRQHSTGGKSTWAASGSSDDDQRDLV